MPFLSILTSLPSLFIKNINLIKYLAIAIFAGLIVWKIYAFYDEHQNLIQERDNLTKELLYTKNKLQEFKAVAKHNQEMLDYEKSRNKIIISELEDRHTKEIAKIKRLSTIKEKTYHEKDGPVAPVLFNTINRLFAKDK